ncbi:MAG: hypothetical protein ACOCWM_03440 [Cyclobacteriaceae bacterium]
MKNITILFLLFISWTRAISCDCDKPEPTVEEIFKMSEVIFTAKVVSINPNSIKLESYDNFEYEEVNIEIVEVLKGNAIDIKRIINQLSSCGTYLQKGKTYLFYPFKLGNSNLWMIHQCHKMSGNVKLPYFEAELKELGRLKEINGG